MVNKKVKSEVSHMLISLEPKRVEWIGVDLYKNETCFAYHC